MLTFCEILINVVENCTESTPEYIQTRKVKKFHIPPYYKFSWGFDMMVIEFDKPFDIRPNFTEPACLPTKGYRYEVVNILSWTFPIIRLLDKPFENEINLTRQNSPSKCC